jgi:N4-gp56 family major capsid protein
MALQTTGSAGLSAEMKTFYDRVLLTRAVPVLLYSRFGQKRSIPKHGGKTIEFRRFGALATATTPLTEGALFTNLKDLTVSTVEATVAGYNDAVGFSDLVSTTTIDPLLTETAEILGEQMGQTVDEVTRDVVTAGTTVVYASTATARTDLTAAMVFDPAAVRKAVLQLKLNRAKKIDGFYHVIIHPRQEHDLISSTEWRDAQNYHRTGRIFDGSIGSMYGCQFYVSDVAKTITDGGAAGADVYAALFIGAEAYGVVNLAGRNARTIFKPLGSAGSADPTDEQSTMAWKTYFVAKILNDAFMVRLETGASTGS